MLRKAFSLIEVVISLALTAVVMVAVSQAITATRNLEGVQAAEDDLISDAGKVQAAILSDVSQSGWHIVPTGTVTGRVVSAVTTPSALSSVASTDRTLQYWPYVMTQRTTPTQFALMRRVSALVNITLPPNLPGSQTDASANNYFESSANRSTIGAQDPVSAPTTRKTAIDAIRTPFLKSWYAPSQELIFLKQVGDSGWLSQPGLTDAPYLNFPRKINNANIDWTDSSDTNRARLKILYPTPYVQSTPGVYALRGGLTSLYGVPLRATVLDQTDSSSFVFRTSWQTMAAPTYELADFVVNTAAPDNILRQYMYAVVPSGTAALGIGRLVRAYKAPLAVLGARSSGSAKGQLISSDATYGMVVDEVLSEHCVRAVFDTARTDASLAINEIRARIYFLRRSNADPSVYVRHVLDMRATMRSRNTANDRIFNDKPIFTSPITGVPGYVY